MTSIRVALVLVAVSIRRLLRWRSLVTNALIFGIPVALAGLGMATASQKHAPREIFVWTMWHLNLYIVLYFGTMVNALASTRSEIEDGTAYYVFCGVLPRWAVILVKLAAVFLTSALFSSASVAGVALVCGQTDIQAGVRFLFIGWVGVLMAGAFYVFCGYAFRIPAAAGIVGTLVFEWIVAMMLPVRIAPYTVTNVMRGLVLDTVLGGVREPKEFFGYTRNWKNFDFLAADHVGIYLTVFTSVIIGLSMLVMTRRSIVGKEVAH